MALDSFTAPQPAPTAGEGAEVWPSILGNANLCLPDWLAADMKARHEAGARKYGTPLRTWNGRDAVVDAYQEALDLVVYTQQARQRLEGLRPDPSVATARLALDVVFHTALRDARWLGELARIKAVPTAPKGARP